MNCNYKNDEKTKICPLAVSELGSDEWLTTLRGSHHWSDTYFWKFRHRPIWLKRTGRAFKCFLGDTIEFSG